MHYSLDRDLTTGKRYPPFEQLGQSIKIGRKAPPTRDHGEKRQKATAAWESWLNFRVQDQFEIKILIMWLINTTSYFL